MEKASNPETSSWFLHPDFHENPMAARLLGNLLLHAPKWDQDAHDPELEFLGSCPGFALVVCAVSYQAGAMQTMQNLVMQQAEAYGALSETLRQASEEDYFCVTTELENQFVALLIPRNGAMSLRTHFPQQLADYLRDCLYRLIHVEGIPLYTVYSMQEELPRLNQSYFRMKNAIVFQDYLQSGIGRLLEIGELEPRPHIGLWNQMDAGSVTFVETLLRGDQTGAMGIVNKMIGTITDWIPPSKDNLLADVQYFFDLVINRLSAQFGGEALEGIGVTDAIFETESLSELQGNLQSVVQRLFQSVRRNASDDTFHLYLDIRSYINDHIREYDLSAGTVAEQFHVSPQLLSIQFKKCFSISPGQYIEQKRVTLIKDYLLHTNLSMDRICELVGMGSVSTLHRVFRKHCGQSPGLFRQAAKLQI